MKQKKLSLGLLIFRGPPPSPLHAVLGGLITYLSLRGLTIVKIIDSPP